MQNSLKGALAAIAGGALLLGGAGSLAYWSDTGTVDGTDIASGTFSLSDADCGDGWLLDGGDEFVAQKLVPGDSVSQVCTFDVAGEGEHLAASFGVTTAALTGDAALTADLDLVAAYEVNGAPVGTSGVAIADGDEITATLSVTFDAASLNTSQDLGAALADVTVTATQSHDPS